MTVQLVHNQNDISNSLVAENAAQTASRGTWPPQSRLATKAPTRTHTHTHLGRRFCVVYKFPSQIKQQCLRVFFRIGFFTTPSRYTIETTTRPIGRDRSSCILYILYIYIYRYTRTWYYTTALSLVDTVCSHNRNFFNMGMRVYSI
jgi:hypothetical protein